MPDEHSAERTPPEVPLSGIDGASRLSPSSDDARKINRPALHPGPLSAASPPPNIPEQALLRRIGEGSYGEVWLARNAVGSCHAVKIVYRITFRDNHPFEREFKGIQKFEPISRSHPGLVNILQVGKNEAEGYFYYVMELADDAEPVSSNQCSVISNQAVVGEMTSLKTEHCWQLNTSSYTPHTLSSELAARKKLPLAECLQIGISLASALGHLHKHGLVHRDVKPSNIIFVKDVLKLADIGLVAEVSEARSYVGTEGFIPPEGPGTPQADLYSLGKLLYEAATGKDRHAFPELPTNLGESSDTKGLVELNAILLQACHPDVRQRYQTAEEMHADLALLQRGKSVRQQRTLERRWTNARKLALVTAGVALLAVFGYSTFDTFVQRRSVEFATRGGRTTSDQRPANTAIAADRASIFVLPFRNAATNSDDGGLSGRLTDAFIDSLRLSDGVTVAPRRSMLSEQPEFEARREAAKLFGVRYVLTGQSDTGTNTTLLLNLYETKGDRPVWSQTFTGTAERLVEMETRAIRALSKQLNAPITPDAEQRIEQKLSKNFAAWKLVQQADKVSYIGRDSVSVALQQYHEALQLDPDYAGAWAGKAQLLRNLTGDRPPNEIWPEIKACGERMLQIDPTSSQGQYFLWATKFLFEWDWEGAEKMFQERRTRRLDWPVTVAMYLRMVGRFDEARVEQEKVKRLDQRHVVVRQHSTAAAFIERDYRKTIELARETQAVFPESLFGLDWLFHAYYHLGQFELAFETIRQRRRIFDEPLCMALEACALAKTGQREAALKILGDLEALSPIHYVDAYPLAWIHLALGDKAAALAKLRQACQQRSEFLVLPDSLAGGLRTDPKLDELREEPEFQELLKLAGLDVWPK